VDKVPAEYDFSQYYGIARTMVAMRNSKVLSKIRAGKPVPIAHMDSLGADVLLLEGGAKLWSQVFQRLSTS